MSEKMWVLSISMAWIIGFIAGVLDIADAAMTSATVLIFLMGGHIIQKRWLR